jgi:hypothetical protein
MTVIVGSEGTPVLVRVAQDPSILLCLVANSKISSGSPATF